VRVPLDIIAHSFPAGHRVRVAVSPAYWPWAWPSPEPVTLTLFGGALELPVRVRRPEDDHPPVFEEPEHAPPLEVEDLAPGRGGRTCTRDLGIGLVEQTFDWDLGGTARLVPIDLETSDTSRTVYSILDGDPLSAAVRFHATTGMARGEWRTFAEVESSMTCDGDAFYVHARLEVHEGADQVFQREWRLSFPRDHV
jgi:hypothetical protein